MESKNSIKKSCVGGGDPITNRSETAPTAILPAELSFVCQTLSPDISNINHHRFDAPPPPQQTLGPSYY